MNNNNFQSYVTSQAFALVLSRPQIEALYWLVNPNTRMRLASLPYLISLQSLARKGLAQRDSGRLSDPWQITEEGKLTLELCKRAGLLDEMYRRRKSA